MQGPATPLSRFLFILSLAFAVAAQHDHSHSHHGEVKSKWDEEEYLKLNPPTPPSYWSEDTRMRMSSDEALPARYPWLMVLHVLFMSGAFFIALPAGEVFDYLYWHPCAALRTPVCAGDLHRISISHTHIRSDPPQFMILGSIIAWITHAYLLCNRLGIALRSVKSSFHALSVVAFYGMVTFGLSSSALYRKLTPDL